MNIQPLSDRVLVKKVQPEEKTQSGIFIGDMQNNKQVQIAIVVAAGPGRDKVPMQVKVGDTIIFAKYAGVETHEDHLMIREDEVFGIVLNNHIGSSFEDFLKESGISEEEITNLALKKISCSKCHLEPMHVVVNDDDNTNTFYCIYHFQDYLDEQKVQHGNEKGMN